MVASFAFFFNPVADTPIATRTKPRHHGMTMRSLASVFRAWFPVALVSFILCGLIHLAVQQDLRQSANDPQIQLAEDAAMSIEQGKAPSTFLPPQTIDIAKSLTPFVVIYDDNGKPIATSGNLNGAPPLLPDGVTDYVKAHGENRVTWQPQPNVRIAAVITRVDGKVPGYVLAGRSLREVEIRESKLELEVGLAFLASLIVSFLALAIFK
jgi:hypothetical protein